MSEVRSGLPNDEVEDAIQIGQVIELDLDLAWRAALALHDSYLGR